MSGVHDAASAAIASGADIAYYESGPGAPGNGPGGVKANKEAAKKQGLKLGSAGGILRYAIDKAIAEKTPYTDLADAALKVAGPVGWDNVSDALQGQASRVGEFIDRYEGSFGAGGSGYTPEGAQDWTQYGQETEKAVKARNAEIRSFLQANQSSIQPKSYQSAMQGLDEMDRTVGSWNIPYKAMLDDSMAIHKTGMPTSGNGWRLTEPRVFQPAQRNGTDSAETDEGAAKHQNREQQIAAAREVYRKAVLRRDVVDMQIADSGSAYTSAELEELGRKRIQYQKDVEAAKAALDKAEGMVNREIVTAADQLPAGRSESWKGAADKLEAYRQVTERLLELEPKAALGALSDSEAQEYAALIPKYQAFQKLYGAGPEHYTPENVDSFIDRAAWLSVLPASQWTEADTEEAKEILKAAGVLNRMNGFVWKADRNTDAHENTEKYGILQSLYARLHPNLNAVMTGVWRGAGLTSLMEAGGTLIGKIGGEPEAAARAMQRARENEEFSGAKAPMLYTGAEIAGNIALLKGIGSVTGPAAAKAIPTAGAAQASTALRLGQTALRGGLTFGSSAAVHGLGDVATGRSSGSEYLRDIGVSSLAGAAGATLADLVAASGSRILAKPFVSKASGKTVTLAKNKLANGLLATVTGMAYAGGDTAVREIAKKLEYGEDYTPDAGEITKNILIAGAFGAIEYALGSLGQRNGTSAAGEQNEPAWKYFNKDMSDEEIKAALRAYTRQYHTDLNPDIDPGIFTEINAEYDAVKRYRRAYGCSTGKNARADKARAESRGDTAAAAQADAEMRDAIATLNAWTDGSESSEITEALEILNAVTESSAPTGEAGGAGAIQGLTPGSANGGSPTQVNIDNAAKNAYTNPASIDDSEVNTDVAGGSPSKDHDGVPGVYEAGGAGSQGRNGSDGAPLGTGFVLLNPENTSQLKQSGVYAELRDFSADSAAFCVALDEAREADTAHGWAVTPKTTEELSKPGTQVYMTANGSTGFVITGDGNIEGVFGNKTKGAPKGVTKSTLPLAVANGGVKLDCYGIGLAKIYMQYGFIPVARVTFDPAEANPGWDPSKGKPDVIFMMHNGDPADAIVPKIGTYPKLTAADAEALPLMSYGEAMEYRDGLLKKQQADMSKGRSSAVSPAPVVNTNSGSGIIWAGSERAEGGTDNAVQKQSQQGILGQEEAQPAAGGHAGAGREADLDTGRPAAAEPASGREDGTGLSDGGRGRDDGARTGGTSERLVRSPEELKRRAAEQGRRAAARQGHANDLWRRGEIEKQSPQELGIRRGVEDKSLLVFPESSWDEEMREAAELAREKGIETTTYVSGLIRVDDGSGNIGSTRGAWLKDAEGRRSVIIQADNRGASVTGIVKHELFHDEADRDPGLVEAVRDEIAASFGEDELRQKLRDYILSLRGVVDIEADPMNLGVAARKVMEELGADASGEINFFGLRTYEYKNAVDKVRAERGAVRKGLLEAASHEIRGPPAEKYSIDEEFAGKVQKWYDETKPNQRTTAHGYFRVGTTSDALISIGARPDRIYMRKYKVGTILEDHPEMDIEDIKRLPEILESPVLVMKSMTHPDSIVVFGELRANNGDNIMASIELTPTPGGDMEAEFSLITSAYTRTRENIQNLIRHSELLYLDPNKKRTNNWLMQLRVQFPSGQPPFGSIGTITYEDDGVNIQGKTLKDLGVEMTIAPDLDAVAEKAGEIPDDQKSPMQRAMEAALRKRAEAGTEMHASDDSAYWEHKEAQNRIIQQYHPKADWDYQTWIESADDIKTFDEATADVEGYVTPDYTRDMIDEAKRTGYITVYSSNTIRLGTFVTPSRMLAQDYAGEGQVKSMRVRTSDVAWIDEEQGQYAKVDDQPVHVDKGPSAARGDKRTAAYILSQNLANLQGITPVSELSGHEMNDRNKDLPTQIAEFFESVGGKVERQGLGTVLLGEYGVGGIMNHKPINRAKMVTLVSVPDVIARGRIINYDPNWKGRGYPSIIIAAPVTVAGKPVYVAAVIDQREGYKFYLNECVDSEGNYIRITEDPSGSTKSGVTVQDGVTRGPEESSGNSILSSEGKSNNELANTELFSADDSGYTEGLTDVEELLATAQRMAGQGASPSQIYNHTGLTMLANGNIINPSTGEIVGRVDRGYTGKLKENADRGQSSRETTAGVPGYDRRGADQGLRGERGTASQRKTWDELGEEQRRRAEQIILEHAANNANDLTEKLIELYGGSGFAEKVFSLYEKGNRYFENAEFNYFSNISALADALDAELNAIDEQLFSADDSGYTEGLTDEREDESELADSSARQRDLQRMAARQKREIQKAIREMKRKAGRSGYEYDPLKQYEGTDDPVKEFVKAAQARAAAAKAARMMQVDKNSFRGSPAMEKLGIRIENSIGNYARVDQLIAAERAAFQLRKTIRKREEAIRPTAKEKEFASGIAAGIYTAEDIPANMARWKVEELADYYWAEKASSHDMIAQRKRDINLALDEHMEDLLRDSDLYRVPKAVAINYSTPERLCRKIFGDEHGRSVYDAVFRPVSINEAEKIRFMNRMFDEVRTFEGRDGKRSELTKEERVLVQQVLEGRAVKELVAGMEIHGMIESAAENILNGQDSTDAAREFQLTEDQAGIARQYARWLQTEKIYGSGDFDSGKIDNAVDKFSEMYNLMYDAINDHLVAHGYDPIGFIKGYAPHMQMGEDLNLFAGYLERLGFNADVTRLPASIAGRTAQFKPGKRWNPHFLQRNGDFTDYDISKGFQSYVSYLADVLYHTDDIMRIRAMGRYYRRTFSPDEIRETLDWVHHNQQADLETKEQILKDRGILSRESRMSAGDISAAFDKWVDEQYDAVTNMTKYSDYVSYLDNYANILAGKQNASDRGAEAMLGREVLNLGNKLVNSFKRTQVAGSLSSALTQTSQLPIIKAELGDRYFFQAIRDIMSGELRRIGWAQQSDFLTGKRGVNLLVTDPFDMIMDKSFTPLKMVDAFTATIAVRGRYLKEIAKGKSHEEALRAADLYAKSAMGSRVKGEMPIAFNSKNPIMQMVNMFQVEAWNQWEHVAKDIPADFRQVEKESGKTAAVRSLASVIVKILIGAFVLNRITEEAYGGTPAMFDVLGLSANFIASGYGLTTNRWIKTIIDNGLEKLGAERIFDTDPKAGRDSFNWKDATENTAYNISNDIPFLRNVTGLMGLGDQSLPLPLMGAGKDLSYLIGDIREDIGNRNFSADTGMDLLRLMNQVVPGGRQLTKLEEGLQLMSQGGRYINDRLYYPVESSPANWVRALLFGRSALPETMDYYAGDDSALSKEQTETFRTLVAGGADPDTVYRAMQDYKAIGSDEDLGSFEKGKEKRAVITNADLTDKERLTLFRGIDSSNAGRADDFETIMKAGASWAETVAAYDKWAQLYADEDLSKSEMAEHFAAWVERQGYTPEEKTAVRDAFKFWQSIPIDETKVDKLTGAGLEVEAAEELTGVLRELEPLPGKTSITDLQKYQAIAASGLSETEQWQAIRAQTNPTYTSTLIKIDILEEKGISPTVWTESKQAMYDADDTGNDNGSTDQKEAKAALDAMDIPMEQKAILWQLTNTSWKAKSNPYNKAVGQKVCDLFAEKKAERDEESAVEEPSATAGGGLVLGSANQRKGLELPEGWDQGLKLGNW